MTRSPKPSRKGPGFASPTATTSSTAVRWMLRSSATPESGQTVEAIDQLGRVDEVLHDSMTRAIREGAPHDIWIRRVLLLGLQGDMLVDEGNLTSWCQPRSQHREEGPRRFVGTWESPERKEDQVVPPVRQPAKYVFADELHA